MASIHSRARANTLTQAALASRAVIFHSIFLNLEKQNQSLDTRMISPHPAPLHITVFAVKLAGLVTDNIWKAGRKLESLRTSPRRPPEPRSANRSSYLVPGTEFYRFRLERYLKVLLVKYCLKSRRIEFSAEIWWV